MAEVRRERKLKKLQLAIKEELEVQGLGAGSQSPPTPDVSASVSQAAASSSAGLTVRELAEVSPPGPEQSGLRRRGAAACEALRPLSPPPTTTVPRVETKEAHAQTFLGRVVAVRH